MPKNTVYAGRPTKWGNQYREGEFSYNRFPVSVEQAIAFYKEHIENNCLETVIKKELKGKNLCCWCPLDQPCHADVLLEIANK